jgi:hypothetical protein
VLASPVQPADLAVRAGAYSEDQLNPLLGLIAAFREIVSGYATELRARRPQ